MGRCFPRYLDSLVNGLANGSCWWPWWRSSWRTSFRPSENSFQYNALGWVTSVDNNGGSTSGTAGVPDVVLNAKYDLNGNRTALNAQVDRGTGDGLKDDFQNAYAFDRLNRMTSVIQDVSGNSGHYDVGYKKTTFAWDAASRLTTLTHYKTSSTQVASGAFSYDHDSRLTSLNWSGYGGPYTGGYFDKLAWSYDSDSRVASFTSGISSNENLTYTYDHDSQLTSAAASYGGYGGGYGGGTYGWDGNGDTTNSGWVTGKGNRLLKDGTYRYWYDESGHITKRVAITGGASTEYEWDARGRMTKATDKNSSGTIQQVIDYNYDAFNELISRSLTPYTSGSAGTPTIARFVYDLAAADSLPSPLAGEGSGVRGAGNAVLAFNGNQSLTDRYLWGPAVDQILADERYSPSGSNVMPSAAGNIYWALTDNENSVRDWIAYGSLVDHIIYDSFGKMYSQSSTSVPFAFMHNGVFYDPATGLEYHSQPSTGLPGRWYNPAIQRWMSEDPLGLGPDSNPYRYVGNSPTNGTDPTGTIVVYVHGIGAGQHRNKVQAIMNGLTAGWDDLGLNHQAVVHFLHGPTDKTDAICHENSIANQSAARQLAKLVGSLQRQRAELKSEEPIFIYAYSNGATVTSMALEQGMTVDGVVFAGSALDARHNMTRAAKQTPFIMNYWSGSDWGASWANGSGAYPFDTTPNNVYNIHVDYVEHYQDGDGSASGRDTDGYTEWDSYYMARNSYSTRMLTSESCDLSKHATLQDLHDQANGGYASTVNVGLGSVVQFQSSATTRAQEKEFQSHRGRGGSTGGSILGGGSGNSNLYNQGP